MKQRLERLRIGLMIALLGCTVLVLSKTSLYPNQRLNTPKILLPITLNLQGWQLEVSEPIQEQQPEFQSGQRYRYLKNGSGIDIEIRHIVNTKGNIKDYLKLYESMNLSHVPTIRQSEKFGFYGVFIEDNRSYLSACINPRGKSTFTGVQFAHNRNTLDMTPDRIFPWLLGQAELRDDRCLWVIFSMPTEGDPESTYHELEDLWFSLYPDLQIRFAQSSS